MPIARSLCCPLWLSASDVVLDNKIDPLGVKESLLLIAERRDRVDERDDNDEVAFPHVVLPSRRHRSHQGLPGGLTQRSAGSEDGRWSYCLRPHDDISDKRGKMNCTVWDQSICSYRVLWTSRVAWWESTFHLKLQTPGT